MSESVNGGGVFIYVTVIHGDYTCYVGCSYGSGFTMVYHSYEQLPKSMRQFMSERINTDRCIVYVSPDGSFSSALFCKGEICDE